ncbi:hypothetical protein [Spirosoma endophyticum]|uniref:Uncharacterized protein n=1 Tax=Spirosoma endophyticum TaxID=662367 RepID=A0A1I2IDG0_9BACT|nr:hypothetical protein [Spirosoma endophyticum]SFF40379.1 hypothetical protein SAMN05216167_1711 [Spirosoma endophyticum]
MNNRFHLFGIDVGSAVFIYIITSFLVGTSDVIYWYNYQRFLAVVAYFILTIAISSGDRKKRNSKIEVDEPKVNETDSVEQV